MRDKRYFFKKYPQLNWGPAQLAHDVIRLKSRLLLDFFYPVNPKPDDMVVDDFGLSGFRAMLDARAMPNIRSSGTTFAG